MHAETEGPLSPLASGARAPRRHRERTLPTQVRLLHEQGLRAIGVSLGVALTLVVLLREQAAAAHLFGWLWVLVAVNAVRCAFVLRYLHRGGAGSVLAWASSYALGTFVAGGVWGALAWLVQPDWPVSYQSIVLISLAGIVAGGLSSNAAWFPAYLAFVVPLALPLTLKFGLSPEPGHAGLAVLVLLYTLALIGAARRFESELLAALELRVENEALVERLRTSNADLNEKQAIIEHEEELARHVFRRLTRTFGPPVPGVDQWIWPTRKFSGDFILTASAPDGAVHLLLGDFTGHGLPAAMGAMPVSSIFHSMTRKGLSLADIVPELERRLHELLPPEYFCCAALARVDRSTGEIDVWNAGLPDVLLVGPDGSVRERFASTNLPLGIAGRDGGSVEPQRTHAVPGAALYIHSDGVLEAGNSAGEPYGRARLEAALCGAAHDPLRALRLSLEGFIGAAPLHDDASVLAARLPRLSG